ncbi:hypothetical protein OF83DRAFT_1178936 [Amylostereum chailletii]|nr:hypothetical protein OF83DRAFT_1178936 [Amylostereum chailletii]
MPPDISIVRSLVGVLDHVPTLSPKEVISLKDHIPDYAELTGDAKQTFVEAKFKDLWTVRYPNWDWKADEPSYEDNQEFHDTMTAFFFRHGKVYLPAEIIKFGQRWTGQDMFNKLMPDQVAAVLDELSPPPEGAIALAFRRLETVDQALLEEEAKRWNEEGLPKEVVQKNASKKMESAMLWMSKWVARECGSYILALIIEPNSNGKLVSYKYDLSKDIGLTKKKFTDTVSVTALGSSHLDFTFVEAKFKDL